jgi:sulfite exporter TauE/SafE
LGLFNLALIFVLGFAFHCPAMCGPVVAVLYPDPKKAWRFHLGRFIGYTSLGVAAGQLGALIYSVGFATLGILGLAGVIMLLTTRSMPTFLPAQTLKRFVPQPIFLGMVFTFIPCHYLWTMVGIAALAGSPALGGAVMAAHALMSAFGVQMFQKIPIYQKLRTRFQSMDRWLIATSVLVLIYRIGSQSELGTILKHPTAASLICW